MWGGWLERNLLPEWEFLSLKMRSAQLARYPDEDFFRLTTTTWTERANRDALNSRGGVNSRPGIQGTFMGVRSAIRGWSRVPFAYGSTAYPEPELQRSLCRCLNQPPSSLNHPTKRSACADQKYAGPCSRRPGDDARLWHHTRPAFSRLSPIRTTVFNQRFELREMKVDAPDCHG